MIESIDDPLMPLIKSLGGIPVADSSWNPDGKSMEVLMSNLMSEYGAPIIVGSWVAADDADSTSHILQVSNNPRAPDFY